MCIGNELAGDELQPLSVCEPLVPLSREASDVIKKGRMCALYINDLDAGAGRMGGATQYTVNNQMVNATLMNIADNPTNVQLPGEGGLSIVGWLVYYYYYYY